VLRPLLEWSPLRSLNWRREPFQGVAKDKERVCGHSSCNYAS
jgi:hypothetical protein